MPFQLPLDAKVSALAAGERQKCEILKQLYLGRRFLILDEPTSVLTPQEADEVLGLLRDMATGGDITVLMITHKFREVMAFAERVTILRHGRVVGGGATADLSPDEMARTMIGAEELAAAPRRTGERGAPRLEIRGLEISDDAGQQAVRDFSLAVHRGEIVGVAGVSGNGQHELVEALAGQRQPDAGAIRMAGERFAARRAEMHRYKFSCLPDEPLKNACVGAMSVAENMAFRSFDRPPVASGGAWLRSSAMRAEARRRIAQYRVQTRSPDTPLAALSGGNVQRAVLARELDGGAEIIIAANPCFGLDFAAVAQIHAELVAARNRGAAVLLVSSDLDEILEIADRLVVMSGGRLVHETPVADADLTEIGRCMAGH
jgi:general nucleoside transport system ATP-binding protein